MSDDTDAGGLHVELYVRALPTTGNPANAVLGQVSTLEQRGIVDSHEVLVWGDRAPTSPVAAATTAGRDIARQVELFREWARRNDVSLRPALRSRTVDSSLRGEKYGEVRLPEVLVATYRGRDLVAVAPHSRGEEVCNVRLYLERLPDESDYSDFVPVERARAEGEGPVATVAGQVRAKTPASEPARSESPGGSESARSENLARTEGPVQTEEPSRSEGAVRSEGLAPSEKAAGSEEVRSGSDRDSDEDDDGVGTPPSL